MRETISELEKVKIGAVKVAGQILITTQADVIKAKNEIRAHYSEIRAILKQIGEWYGFNAPKQLDHTTKGESLHESKMQKINVVIKEHNPNITLNEEK